MATMKAMLMQNANLASLIKCVFGDLLALRTAAEFSLRQQNAKNALKVFGALTTAGAVKDLAIALLSALHFSNYAH